MVFDVWLDDRQGSASHCGNEIPIGPQRPQAGTQPGKFLSGLVDDLLQTRIHTVEQDLACVFGAPNPMVLGGIDDVSIGFEIRTHVLYYTAYAA